MFVLKYIFYTLKVYFIDLRFFFFLLGTEFQVCQETHWENSALFYKILPDLSDLGITCPNCNYICQNSELWNMLYFLNICHLPTPVGASWVSILLCAQHCLGSLSASVQSTHKRFTSVLSRWFATVPSLSL